MPTRNKPPVDPDSFEAMLSTRLNSFINEVARSQRKFAETVGESSTNVNNYTRGTMPPISFLVKVLESYPRFNVRWWLLGDGEMLLPEAGGVGTLGLVGQLIGQFVREGGSRRGIHFNVFDIEEEGGEVVFRAEGRIRAGRPGMATEGEA